MIEDTYIYKGVCSLYGMENKITLEEMNRKCMVDKIRELTNTTVTDEEIVDFAIEKELDRLLKEDNFKNGDVE